MEGKWRGKWRENEGESGGKMRGFGRKVEGNQRREITS